MLLQVNLSNHVYNILFSTCFRVYLYLKCDSLHLRIATKTVYFMVTSCSSQLTFYLFRGLFFHLYIDETSGNVN